MGGKSFAHEYLQNIGKFEPSLVISDTYFSIKESVVVSPHLWIDIVEVPLKAFALESFPER